MIGSYCLNEQIDAKRVATYEDELLSSTKGFQK